VKSRRIKRILFLLTFAVLTAVLILSSVMAALAWSDFTQSKTNDFRGTVGKTAVTLHKYEKDPDGNIVARPVASADFLLYKSNFDGTWTQTGGLYTTGASGKITVEKLNSGHYKFVEQAPGYGYAYDKDGGGGDIREYPFTVAADDAGGPAAVTVDAYNRRLQSGLEISKTVKTQDGSALRPEQINQEFTFTVNFSDGGTYECAVNSEKLTVKSGGAIALKHGEKAVFSSLPVGLYYEVLETAGPGYIISSAGNTGNIAAGKVSKAQFTNTAGKPGPQKTKVTVKKQVAGEIPEEEKGRAFGFTMAVNGEEVHFTLKSGEEKAFILDSGDTYGVKEDDPFAWGYIQSGIVNGAGTASAPEIAVSVTNTYVGGIQVTVGGEKTWDFGPGFTGQATGSHLLPASITVELLANGEAAQAAVVRPGKDGKWLYSFRAPKYDAQGKPVVYTVREVPVPGFNSSVTGNDIKNTWAEPATDAPAKVRKLIAGAAPSPADTFTFNMKAVTPDAPMPATAQIAVTGEGEANFGDIRFANAGIYVYEISEIKGAASCAYDETVYAMTVTVEEQDGKLSVKPAEYTKPGNSISGGAAEKYGIATFVNVYGGPGDPGDPGGADEIVLSGSKTWNHGGNPVASRPSSITVHIKDGGKTVAQAVITEADHWQWSFKLPRTRADGTAIRYSVDEAPVPGYTKAIDGYNLINTYDSSAPGTVTLNGKKTWNFGDAPATDRPGSITVYIMNGTKIAREITVTAADGWRWSAVLPQSDGKGDPVHYTVEEGTVPHYAHQADGYDLINTYKGQDYPGDPGPETGDGSDIWFWTFIMLASLTLFLALLLWGICNHQFGYKDKYDHKRQERGS
jgi:pilin isopeptide linkage protein